MTDKKNLHRVTCRGVDVTDHVARMFAALAGSVAGAEDAEALLAVAELVGLEAPEVVEQDRFDPPGLAPFEDEPVPEEARMPNGGWPGDRPEVWEKAHDVLAAHEGRAEAARAGRAEERREALLAWRDRVQARARASADDDRDSAFADQAAAERPRED